MTNIPVNPREQHRDHERRIYELERRRLPDSEHDDFYIVRSTIAASGGPGNGLATITFDGIAFSAPPTPIITPFLSAVQTVSPGVTPTQTVMPMASGEVESWVTDTNGFYAGAHLRIFKMNGGDLDAVIYWAMMGVV